jgi:hypothetical protein
LHFVGDAAEGDDGPVLKFKRRDDIHFRFELFFGFATAVL